MAAARDLLVWSAEAGADLLSIWQFGAHEWSLTAADDHQRALERATRRLLENAQLGRSRDELILGLRSIVVDPHVVFYRISSTAIEIVRVVNQREDIETIFH
jgi:toxin ParE1/3/4